MTALVALIALITACGISRGRVDLCERGGERSSRGLGFGFGLGLWLGLGDRRYSSSIVGTDGMPGHSDGDGRRCVLRYSLPVTRPTATAPTETVADIVIVGAGIAGLSCARTLRAARPGLRVVVVDKARGVGGRCATRRFDGQPVDHALSFLHGSDPGFIDVLNATAGCVEWPRRVVGDGAPCLPRAFEPGERRFAFAAGLTTFAKGLAAGVELATSARIVGCEPGRLLAEDGRSFAAPTIIVTAPVPQAQALLEELAKGEVARSGRDGDALGRLLEELGSLSPTPCLTAIAGYSRDRVAPPWDILYPRGDRAIARISHDSSKRSEPQVHALVVQATPSWSIEQLEEPPAEWGAELLAAAAAHLPQGLGQPLWTFFQRWRYANLGPGERLGSPMMIELDGGRRLGLTGSAFSAKGGAEGAFLAGVELGERVLERLG